MKPIHNGIYSHSTFGIVNVEFANKDQVLIRCFSDGSIIRFNGGPVPEEFAVISPVIASKLGFGDKFDYIRTLSYQTLLLDVIRESGLLCEFFFPGARSHDIKIKSVCNHIDQKDDEVSVTLEYLTFDPEDDDRVIRNTTRLTLKVDPINIFGNKKQIITQLKSIARAEKRRRIADLKKHLEETRAAITRLQKRFKF